MKRGFTLIEMLISVALFAIVMVSVSAAYLNLVNLDKQARATNDVVSNLSFALDSISRGIRTGSRFQCGGPGGGNCPLNTPSSEFTFYTSDGVETTYLLNTSTHQIGQCTGSVCNPSIATYFTDPRITVSTLSFYVTGVGTGDNLQPQVVFTIRGTIPSALKGNTTPFTIQTTATERGIDI
jgi:prepilin-type N-terminal cleavage/methylation domain-containing protein